ncbi:MAG: hypothetical protein ACRDF4_12230, partial [Rhabdochlamydiaceae bacterium]
MDIELKQSSYGYGKDYRCSQLQFEWQTSHPTFKAVIKGMDVIRYLEKTPLATLLNNPPLLLPLESPEIWHKEPKIIDYVQLPLFLWVPDFFYPSLVTHMPCPLDDCPAVCTRQRWRSGGPRVIHDINHAMYLHTFDYKCPTHGIEFAGWDDRSLSRLHPVVRNRFQFFLTAEEGVTLVLLSRIINCRLSAGGFNALRNEISQSRHERMYQAIENYHLHCLHHHNSRLNSLLGYFSVNRGTTQHYPALPPILHNPDGYYDHDPLSVKAMSAIYQSYCKQQLSLWIRYSQQFTAKRVSIDSTFKIAKRIPKSPTTRLWSMVDIDTGIILVQQLLTHESHVDVCPMLGSYASRCHELKAPLPIRVCSDRGLMDKNLITHHTAFPRAHINVDNWHFVELFAKTLNRHNP